MWQQDYDEENEQTTIKWNGNEQCVVDGHLSWQNGLPRGKARYSLIESIKESDSSDQTEMLIDLIYGFQDN